MVGNDNNSEFSMKYPPGFTPNEGTDAASMHMEGGRNDNVENLNDCNKEEANVIFSGNRSTMNSKDDEQNWDLICVIAVGELALIMFSDSFGNWEVAVASTAKYKVDLEDVEAIIDNGNGNGNEEVVNKRAEIVNNLQSIDKLSFVRNDIIDRQILDGPFILNEVLQWCKSNIMVFMLIVIKVKRAARSCQPFLYWAMFPTVRKAHGLIGSKVLAPKKEDVIKAFHGMDGIDLIKFMRIKLGNGQITSFWEDTWSEGGTLLKNRAPRGGVEQEQFDEIVALVNDVILAPISDRWTWTLESSGDFSVASVRKLIDDKSIPVVDYKTRWIKYVPIKVNVHAWKVKSDSLPTKFNISRRGIYIDSIMCAICDKGAETSSHLFFSCCMVRQVVRLITRWWDVPYMEFESYDGWLAWLVNLRLPYKNKIMLEGVFYVMWWHLWTFRNKTIFEAKAPAKALFFDDVVCFSRIEKPLNKTDSEKCEIRMERERRVNLSTVKIETLYYNDAEGEDQKELNIRPRRLLRVLSEFDYKIRYHPGKASVAADALSRNEQAKPLRVRALVITINSNLPPRIHETQVEALKKENVKDENLQVSPMAQYGSMHRHLCQQMHDVFKDEGRFSEAIRFTSTARNTPLEIGKCSHGFYHKTTKENKHYDTIWKRMSDEPLAILLDEIQVDDKLNFIEEPIEIMNQEVKRLKQSHIPIVKVRWNSRRGLEFTWEREDQMQKKYPHLFTNSAPAAEVAS
ncbi:RNA-directed DNA polymerase, eukaryota [Tanacetum coccineum]